MPFVEIIGVHSSVGSDGRDCHVRFHVRKWGHSRQGRAASKPGYVRYEDEHLLIVAEGEPGLAGFKVYVDLNGDGAWQSNEPYDVSAADGSYYVTGVPAGTYEVREALTAAQAAAGWTCSKPSGLARTGVRASPTVGASVRASHCFGG